MLEKLAIDAAYPARVFENANVRGVREIVDDIRKVREDDRGCSCRCDGIPPKWPSMMFGGQLEFPRDRTRQRDCVLCRAVRNPIESCLRTKVLRTKITEFSS
jgi:hypothetical protein